MCRFQQTSHWIFMLRTPRASDFLIFVPSIDYLKLSSGNCFDYIISDLIKCFTIIFFFNFYSFFYDDFFYDFLLWTSLTIFFSSKIWRFDALSNWQLCLKSGSKVYGLIPNAFVAGCLDYNECRSIKNIVIV